MEKETFEIKPIFYLAGFHLHKPDYNLKSIRGELYNFVSEKTNRVFEIIPIDDHLEILKSAESKLFEVRFESSSLIYQDADIDYKSFKVNALEIIKKLQSLSPNAKKLKIAGVIRKILLSNEAPKSVYNSRIYDHYFKNFNISGKKKNLSLHLNYTYDKRGLDYNINLNIDEVLKKNYSYEMRIDVNKYDFDRVGNIDFNKVIEIFEFAEKYFNEELFNDINLLVK